MVFKFKVSIGFRTLCYELVGGWTLLNDEYRKKTDVPKLSVLNAILAALPRSELDFAL